MNTIYLIMREEVINMNLKRKKVNIRSIKLQLTIVCNMFCLYCFDGHGVKLKMLSYEEFCSLISELTKEGCEKIAFIGGEPTLHPQLADLIRYAKGLGLATTIVTNGSGITYEFIFDVNEYLDVVCLSVDSTKGDSIREIGRICKNKIIDDKFYYGLVDKIKSAGLSLKINTVVNSINFNEDLSGFINYAAPERWRVFKVIPITSRASELAVSPEEFDAFRARHLAGINYGIDVDFAENAILSANYLLVDPAGRFFHEFSDKRVYSDSILEVGVERALNQIYTDSAVDFINAKSALVHAI
jgi:radical S-adenosyl methionine domain-containing protein 2